MGGPTIGPMQPTPDVPTTPPSVPAPATTPVSDEQIAQTADAILDTGDRPIIADDYDARSVRFAQEMEKLSPEDGARLMQSLLGKDNGAMASWMTMPIIARMHGQGHISDAQFSTMSNAFAQAYNSGRIDDAQARQFLQVQSLQDGAPANAADQFNQLRAFLGAGGNSPEMQVFREHFSESLLKTSLGDNAAWAGTLPGLAMQIAADSGDPSMPARAFASVVDQASTDPAVRENVRNQLLNAVGQASIGYENSRGGVDAVNPLATLVGSVAQQPNTTQWNETAVAIARYAGSAGDNDSVFYDMYSHKPVTDVSTALSNLLGGAQGDAILTELTTWDTTVIGGESGHAQQYGKNAIELAGLLRQTAFNPDNPASQTALDAVQHWAQMRKDFLGGVQRDDYPPGLDVSKARQDLGMLGGASVDAVSQMKIDEDNRAAATAKLVGFVVDLGLSVVPGGGTISGLVGKDLKAAFGDNPRISALIDEALKGGDQLTSAQIDALKSGIADAVNGGSEDLNMLRANVSNFVENAVLTGLPRGTQDDPGSASYDSVVDKTQIVQTEIDDVRGS